MDGIMREISVYANIQRQVSRHKKVVGPPKMAKSHFEVIDFRELWGNMISTRQRNEQASKQASWPSFRDFVRHKVALGDRNLVNWVPKRQSPRRPPIRPIIAEREDRFRHDRPGDWLGDIQI